jgi:hypothetical protein
VEQCRRRLLQRKRLLDMADIAKEISSSEYAIDGNLSRFTWMPFGGVLFHGGHDVLLRTVLVVWLGSKEAMPHSGRLWLMIL